MLSLLPSVCRHYAAYVAPSVWRWIIFVMGCSIAFYVPLVITIHTLTYLHPPRASVFTPYQGLPGRPVDEFGACMDDLGPCSNFSSQMGYHGQSNFTTQIQSFKGPIRTIRLRAENGLITRLRLRCSGVEIADVVALWHRPDRIKVETQRYSAYWDTVGLLVEGQLYSTFDYHAPVESLTYTYLPAETD